MWSLTGLNRRHSAFYHHSEHITDKKSTTFSTTTLVIEQKLSVLSRRDSILVEKKVRFFRRAGWIEHIYSVLVSVDDVLFIFAFSAC